MKRFFTENSMNVRAVIALLLSIVLVGLVLERIREQPEFDGPASAIKGVRRLDAAIDTALRRRGIDVRLVKTRHVKIGNEVTTRWESHIDVSPSFASIPLQHDLAVALVPFGASIIATEHMKEETVVMHIRQERHISRTLVFHTAEH